MKKYLTSFLLSILPLLSFAQFKLEPLAMDLYRRPQEDTLSVFIIGDVMMHKGQLGKDYGEFLRRISGPMRKADIAVANMEFTLGGKPFSGYPCFSAPDGYADYVAGECGADVFLTANNHILDRGEAGLERTLERYDILRDSLGVLNTGTARNREEQDANTPLIINRKGFRLAFVNFTYGTNCGNAEKWPAVNILDEERLGNAFRKAREAGADFIVALPHWGEEYRLHHCESQEKWARLMAGLGADVIVGAHPHVVQDTSHINGVPVLYSIGNAVSNMSAPNTRLELAVTLRFVRKRPEDTMEMLEPELRFMWCTLPGRLLPDGYATVFVDEMKGKRDRWLRKDDYDDMMATLERVKAATGIAKK